VVTGKLKFVLEIKKRQLSRLGMSLIYRNIFRSVTLLQHLNVLWKKFCINYCQNLF